MWATLTAMALAAWTATRLGWGIAWPWAARMAGLVPLKAWLIGAGLILLALFAGWNRAEGRKDIQVKVDQAVIERVQEVRASDQLAIDKATTRAEQAEVAAALREKEFQDAIDKISKTKDSGAVCLPASVVDGLRNIR